MADVLSTTSAIISLASAFRIAAARLWSDSKKHPRFLLQVTTHVDILEHCASVIQNAPESKLLDTVREAANRCAELGADLSRIDRAFDIRKRLNYVLVEQTEFESLSKDFIASVSSLYSLVQSLTMQEMQQDLIRVQVQQIEMHNGLMPLWGRLGSHLEYQSVRTTNVGATSDKRATSPGRPASQRVRQDWESTATGESRFTIGAQSSAEAMTLAEEVVAKSVARGVHFDPDPSLVLGTVAIVHEVKPRFVPVRVKYDTGSDANFVPFALIEKNGLSEFLVNLETDPSESNVFVGLNDQEYVIHHTIEIQWSAATMRNVRTTQFHVAEDLPYDMILGNSFVQENKVFHPQRVALPLHHKHQNSTEKKEEKERKEAHQLAAGEVERQTRSADARRRALARAAIKLAKEQTSAQASADRLRMHNSSNISLSERSSTLTLDNIAEPPGLGSSTVTSGQITSGTATPIASSSIFTSNSSYATSATSQSTTPTPAPITSTNSAKPTTQAEMRTKATEQVDGACEENVTMDAVHS